MTTPRTPEQARTCIHGNTVWYGHECGICEDNGEYRWSLSDAPPYVEWFAANGELSADETIVGFFAETVPDGPGRVRPDLWVVVTTQGLYYLDPRRELVVRARSVHPLLHNRS